MMTSATAPAPEKLDELAYDFAPIGIVLTEDRVIRACNRTFAALFGYEKSELLGQSFRLLYASHAEFEQIRDVGIEALKAGENYWDERVMPRRDGSLFWCRVRVHTFFPEEPLKRVILTFADLSEVRPVISLTLRERQVVQHLAQGLTSKEIGRRLEISPRTVEEHRARLLAKFDARNVAELLVRLGGIAAGPIRS
jgi:PAS domain S-box-containing protein